MSKSLNKRILLVILTCVFAISGVITTSNVYANSEVEFISIPQDKNEFRIYGCSSGLILGIIRENKVFFKTYCINAKKKAPIYPEKYNKIDNPFYYIAEYTSNPVVKDSKLLYSRLQQLIYYAEKNRNELIGKYKKFGAIKYHDEVWFSMALTEAIHLTTDGYNSRYLIGKGGYNYYAWIRYAGRHIYDASMNVPQEDYKRVNITLLAAPSNKWQNTISYTIGDIPNGDTDYDDETEQN